MSEAIKQKAREYRNAMRHVFPIPTSDVDPAAEVIIPAYTAGYEQCRKDMLEAASEGLTEWHRREYLMVADHTFHEPYSAKAWVASALHSQKKIDELEAKYKKLKSLLLLTNYSVSDVVMNDTALIQWKSFLLDLPDEADNQATSKDKT